MSRILAAPIAILLCLIMPSYSVMASPVSVKTVRYDDVAFYPVHSTAAEVIARHDSAISAEISAAVINVNHDTGDRVSEGDSIITLDCRAYELQLRQAKAAHDAVIAQLDNARKLLESARQLNKQNNISREVFDQRKADAARLQAESLNTAAGIENALIAVQNCTIKAPYDGFVRERFVSKGEYVQPGTPAFQMVTAEQGQVDAHINSFEYQSFLMGEDYAFNFDGTRYPLKVDNILPVLDQNYRTHTARLSFSKKPAPTGSHGELTWRDQKRALPSSLVVIRDNQAGVLAANSDRAEFVAVDGYVEGHPVTIELAADTRIITTGRHGLKHGDAINIVPSE